VLREQDKVVAQGAVADLMTRLDLPLARYANAASILEGSISTHDPHLSSDMDWHARRLQRRSPR